MKCPKCIEVLGDVWVQKPGKNGIYKLDDVQYCWKCGHLFLAKPDEIKVQSSASQSLT